MEMKYVMLFALLLSVPLVSAEGMRDGMRGGMVKEFRGNALDAAMANIKCKLDFSSNVIDTLSNAGFDTSSLSSSLSTLTADEAKLQSYADASDVAGFRTYMRGTVEPDLKTARQAVIDWRKSTKNVSVEERASIVKSYRDLHTSMESCHSDSLKNFANSKIGQYNDVLDKASSRTTNLSARGVDVSGLTSLVSDARAQIVTPLQSAVDSAQTAAEVRAALEKYCLFDGCKAGTNFHFAAKYDVARLNGILGSLQNVTSDSAQGALSDAQSVLDSAGTSQFTSDQAKQIAGDLKEAAESIREMLSSMRASK